MNKQYQSQTNGNPDIDLAYQQALKYGQDMAEIYKQERMKRAALQVAYSKLEGALESMSDGFIVVDEALSITEVNQACLDLFELHLENALGMPLNTLLIGNETDAFCNLLQGTERTKLIHQLELLMPTARTLLIHAAPLPSGSWVLVLHDVTWEERVNNFREEFLNLAAHELRTPLAGIIGFASLLEQSMEQGQEELSADTTIFLSKILKSAERLKDTVNDLLDFTVSRSQDIRVQALDLREIVIETEALLNKQAVEHNVTVSYTLPDEPMTIFGEQHMLSVAIGHLIENAIRYNKPNGTLKIEGVIKPEGYDLIFTDTGVGLTRKDLDYIFRPFFQVEEHTTRRSVGMGLGLPIVQRTLSLHKGSIKAESEPNVGSVFTLTLPRFSSADMELAKSEWLKIQRNLHDRDKSQSIDEATQNLINSLKTQLQVTQSQSLAYAEDLAKLYQHQRENVQTIKAKDDQLSHTDRLAMMGQLAAGVAHDLSNLIGPILGYSQVILRNRHAIDASLVDIIERILGTSRRANVLLRQMVNLSKVHGDEQEPVDLNELTDEILRLLEVKINNSEINLVENYDDALPLTLGTPVQISQVILNIVVNAVDVLESGGRLTVSTSVVSKDDKEFVQLTITDTGGGMPPDVQDRIFEPFFTTKQNQSGTGLGLSICRDIIDSHQGTISVESKLGTGTTFTIMLPVAEEELV
ncbi:MAG: ATP-binding protein [Chloroflexota bacterium]